MFNRCPIQMSARKCIHFHITGTVCVCRSCWYTSFIIAWVYSSDYSVNEVTYSICWRVMETTDTVTFLISPLYLNSRSFSWHWLSWLKWCGLFRCANCCEENKEAEFKDDQIKISDNMRVILIVVVTVAVCLVMTVNNLFSQLCCGRGRGTDKNYYRCVCGKGMILTLNVMRVKRTKVN
jgi:hypothetical protein